jgi:hypothetical protein
MAVPKPKTPGQFDNRWMTFPQDFPSASFLREAGITNAIVIGMGDNFPQTDLIHILLRWQQGGIPIQKLSMAPGSHPAPMELRRPSWFGFAFQRLLATFGLRRSEGGGFGSVVPDPHQSGGRG